MTAGWTTFANGADPLHPFPERWVADGGAVVISTHCLLPSGDHVTVAVKRDERSGLSFVSDYGCAWEAVSAFGADPDSSRLVNDARRSAQGADWRFSRGLFYVSDVPDHRLPGTIIALANHVQSWVARTATRHVQITEAALDATLLLALERRFGPAAVTREPIVPGDSTRDYTLTATVKLDDARVGLFRTVSVHTGSLYACHAAFGDIARARPDWPRVAVLADQTLWLAPDLVLLGQEATHILDMSRSPDALLLRLAEAA
jgi:hypothetical protein